MNLNYKAKGLWKEYKVKMATHCNPSGAQWAHTIYTIMVHILVAPPLWIQTAKAPCPKAFQIMCHQKELPWYSTCHKQYRKQQSVSQVQGEQTQQMWCDSHSHMFAPLLLKPMPCIFQCFQWLHQKPWFQGSQRGNWYGGLSVFVEGALWRGNLDISSLSLLVLRRTQHWYWNGWEHQLIASCSMDGSNGTNRNILPVYPLIHLNNRTDRILKVCLQWLN